jgi:hypothetical protein
MPIHGASVIIMASFVEHPEEHEEMLSAVLEDPEEHDGDLETPNTVEQPLTTLAIHPHLLPAVISRFFTDQDVARCLCVSKPLNKRLATHNNFWRYMCHRTYRLPAYRPPPIAGLSKLSSWRDYWHRRPRVHTHGFYTVKISYIPTRRKRNIPLGHREVGSELPARQAYSDIRMVTYYRHFWFQPNGVVRHACVPHPPEVVAMDPGGFWPLSTSNQCLGRIVNVGSYEVRKRNVVHVTIPNIGPDASIVIQMKIAYEAGRYGSPPLKPKPPYGSFNMLLPLSFDMKARAFNGDYRKTPMPITFGEVYNFRACSAPSTVAQAADIPGSGVDTETSSVSVETKVSSTRRKLRLRPVAAVLPSSEEEKAAFQEAAL